MKKSNKLLNGFMAFVILASSLAVALFLNIPGQIEKYYEDSFKSVQNGEQAEDETVDWLVYENNEIGIKFKYPKILGEAETFKISSKDKDAPSYLEGEKISIRFNENNSIYISAHTADYKGFIDFGSFVGSDNIVSECKNPLEYSNKGDVCKIIDIDGEKAIWGNYFSEIECSSSFGTKIYFNNKNSSIYKGLSILFYLDDAGSEIHNLYNNCWDEKGKKESYILSLATSKNIMEGENLSNSDKQKLNAINKIISTFEFIEPKNEATGPKDETVDWLSYGNEKYGYRVKYPKNWFYELEEGGQQILFDYKNDDDEYIKITVASNKTLKEISEELSSLIIYNAPPITQKKIKFHGLDAIYSTGDFLGYAESVFVEYNQKIYKIEYYIGKVKDKNDYEFYVFNKIIDGFEFIK